MIAYPLAGKLLARVSFYPYFHFDSISLSHFYEYIRQSLKELQRSNQSIENECKQMEEHFKRIKQQVLAYKNKATEMADIVNDEELKARLEDLETDISVLEAQIDDAEYNISNIQDNPQVLIQYAEQKKKLKDFSNQFENLKDFKGAKRNELISCLEPYEAALTNITHKVNAKFMNYMKELGCAGKWRKRSESNMITNASFLLTNIKLSNCFDR